MGTHPSSQKSGRSPPIFGPRLLWPNRCMDQDATWYGGRPRRTRHCVRWRPSSPPVKGHSPQFLATVRCGQTAGWTDATWYGGRPRPRRLCVRWGPSYPQKKGHTHPHVYCGQRAGWMKTPLGTEVYLGPGHIAFDGVPALRERGTAAPLFSVHVNLATVAHLSYC